VQSLPNQSSLEIPFLPLIVIVFLIVIGIKNGSQAPVNFDP
jgi:hypothetical protein